MTTATHHSDDITEPSHVIQGPFIVRDDDDDDDDDGDDDDGGGGGLRPVITSDGRLLSRMYRSGMSSQHSRDAFYQTLFVVLHGLKSGLGLHSGLDSIFAGLGLGQKGLGLGLETTGLDLGLGLGNICDQVHFQCSLCIFAALAYV